MGRIWKLLLPKWLIFGMLLMVGSAVYRFLEFGCYFECKILVAKTYLENR